MLLGSVMKPYALFFATNPRFFFSLGVLLLSLREKSPALLEQADVLIYHQGLTPAQQNLLNNIIPCQFTEYYFPLKTDFDNINFKNFTQLAFARYDIFDLLDKYKKILYMDVDILINGELLPVVEKMGNKSGIVMSQDLQKNLSLITKNFNQPLPDYDMTVPCYNSGVILFSQAIKNRKQMRMWCYQKTVQWLENLVCPDQGVLNVLLQEFKIPVEILPDTCNCLPANKKYYDKKSNEVLVYHCAGGGLRFWSYTWFGPWQKFYDQYLKLGGTPHQEQEQSWLRFIKKHYLQRFSFFDRSPNPQIHPHRFITYCCKKLVGR